ncbi:MAG: hypothetical protein LPK03_16265, partial [Pontibacter sp.]|nr:hypothetical protein [Pontibacter sp.]
SAVNHQALDISKVAYVEVLDKEQVPVLQGKVALENGRGNGSFNLPLSLNSGPYMIRAYTNWLKNFGPDLFFVKPLTIVNTFKPLGLEPQGIAADYDVQFFPEGGHLVNNLPATVAVKAADANGKGADFAGAVLNQANDTVATFQTLKFGMGRFSFVPKPGNRYRAVLRGSEGQIITRNLPASRPKGATMQLASDGADKLKLTVHTSAESAELSTVYLLVHTRGKVKVAEAKHTDATGQVQFSIPKATVGEGISHFTVFNAAKQPVCERLYFKKPTHLLQVNAATDQTPYSTRAKVGLAVKTRSLDGADEAADLSVAVFRLDSLNSSPQQSIESYLWLTSEL